MAFGVRLIYLSKSLGNLSGTAAGLWALLFLCASLSGRAQAERCVTCWDIGCLEKKSMMEPCAPVSASPKPVVTKPLATPPRPPVTAPLRAKPLLPKPLPASSPRSQPVRPQSSQSIGGARELVRNLSITSEPPGAAVTIDDVDRGLTPITGVTLRPGRHRFTAQSSGYRTVSEDRLITQQTRGINLKLERVPEPSALTQLTASSELTTVMAPRPPLSTPRKVLATWLGVSFGIALGTGIALAVIDNVDKYHLSDPDNMCAMPPCYFRLYPQYSIAFGVAGVTLVGMVLSLTLPNHNKPTQSGRNL